MNGLVDAGLCALDLFGGPVSYNSPILGGTLTSGDGGKIGFDLNTTVSTGRAPYIYWRNRGLAGEVLTGASTLSSDNIEPTGDLSTDLGAGGPDGDAAKFTYRFTPTAGDTAFSLDLVLFSEEFPEFDGLDPTDLYSIKLNGVEIGALSNGAALTAKNLIYGGSGDLISIHRAPGLLPMRSRRMPIPNF